MLFFLSILACSKSIQQDSFFRHPGHMKAPSNLQECIVQLDIILNASSKQEIKASTEDDFVVMAHFGLGAWMRNHWKLWGNSRLSKHFHDLQIYHADDMSSMILTAYHRHLQENDKTDELK